MKIQVSLSGSYDLQLKADVLHIGNMGRAAFTHMYKRDNSIDVSYDTNGFFIRKRYSYMGNENYSAYLSFDLMDKEMRVVMMQPVARGEQGSAEEFFTNELLGIFLSDLAGLNIKYPLAKPERWKAFQQSSSTTVYSLAMRNSQFKLLMAHVMKICSELLD